MKRVLALAVFAIIAGLFVGCITMVAVLDPESRAVIISIVAAFALTGALAWASNVLWGDDG